MDIIVIGLPGTGHSYAMRAQRSMELTSTTESTSNLIIGFDPEESTCVSDLSFLIRNIPRYPVYFRHERYDLPQPYQYKRVFISKPNSNQLKVIKSKGFIRQRIYH